MFVINMRVGANMQLDIGVLFCRSGKPRRQLVDCDRFPIPVKARVFAKREFDMVRRRAALGAFYVLDEDRRRFAFAFRRAERPQACGAERDESNRRLREQGAPVEHGLPGRHCRGLGHM